MSNKMDKYRQKLADINKPRKGGKQIGDFITLEQGKNLIRLLPGHPNMDGFYVEAFQHHRRLGQTSISIVCPNKGDEDAGNCPICELLEPLRKSKDKKKKDMYYDCRAKSRYYANAINRADEEPKVQILAFGQTILQQVLEAVVDEEEFGDILDPIEGRDLMIKRNGEKLDTTYTVTPRTATSPILDSKKAIKALIGTEEDTQLLDLTVLCENDDDEKTILARWNGADDTEDEEDEEDEKPVKKGKKSSKATDDDEDEEDEKPAKKGKKASKPADDDDDDEEEEEKPAKKGKKAPAPADDDDDDEEEAVPPKKGKKSSKSTDEDEDDEKPAKKGKKAPVSDDDDDDDDEPDLNAVLARHSTKKGKK